MANGARRELAGSSTQHTSSVPTHTYTLPEKDVHTLPTIPLLQPHPPTTNWCRAEDCTFPDPAASLELLHYLDLVYHNTRRHWGLQECMTVLQSHKYTHIVAYSHPGKAIENTFSFPGAIVCFTFNHYPAWELPVDCWPQSSTSCLAQGQTMSWWGKTEHYSFTSSSSWLVERLKRTVV